MTELEIIPSQTCQSRHKPSQQQQSLDQAEDDEDDREYDVRIVEREPCTTDKGFTTLSSELFHVFLLLEFHGMIVKGLEPRFVMREPHSS